MKTSFYLYICLLIATPASSFAGMLKTRDGIIPTFTDSRILGGICSAEEGPCSSTTVGVVKRYLNKGFFFDVTEESALESKKKFFSVGASIHPDWEIPFEPGFEFYGGVANLKNKEGKGISTPFTGVRTTLKVFSNEESPLSIGVFRSEIFSEEPTARSSAFGISVTIRSP